MSSRIPPSQRDRNDLAAALRQTDRNVKSNSGPGFFGGRLAFPQPVPGSAYVDALFDDDDGGGTEEEVDSPTWEDRDRYVLTSADVARGHFRHQLMHTEIVADREFNVLMNGASLDPSRYSLDAENGVVVVALTGWEKPKYHVRFLYAYTGIDTTPPPPGPFPWDLVHYQTQGANYGTTFTTVAIDPGVVRKGDLLVLAMVGGFGDGAQNDEPDTRFTRFGGGGGLPALWYWVSDQDDPPNINILLSGGYNAFGQEVHASLVVARGTQPMSVDVARSREDVWNNGAGANMPAIPGEGSGAIAVVFSYGGVGGGYFYGGWQSPYVGYAGSGDGAYHVAAFGYSKETGDIPQTDGPTNDGSDSVYTFVLALGLGASE